MPKVWTRWSPQEIHTLRKLYPNHSNAHIADILQRTVRTVAVKAHRLGLRKSIGRLQEMGRHNVSIRWGDSR